MDRKPVEVRAAALPQESLIRLSLSRIDYADAFEARFPSAKAIRIEDVACAFFSSAPRWVSLLMRLRNRIVSLVGLKSPKGFSPHSEGGAEIRKGSSFGLFKVLEKTDTEIISGEDDKHLDFRVSMSLTSENSSETREYRLVLSTVVEMHNLMGRLYFAPVKVFHKRIVPAIIRRMVASLS